MLGAFTIFIMLAVAYAQFREGLFTALTMCLNVLIAGLVAFNFWEPLANLLDPLFQANFLAGYEDAIVLVFLFTLTLGLLRLITNNFANTVIDYPQLAQQGGAAVAGLLTGYLVCGFMVCVLQTLPWHKNFMGFDYRYSEGEDAFRRLFPPDRVWLAMMRRAGAYPLANKEDPQGKADANKDSYHYDLHTTFDKYGTFELRYERYRRYDDSSNPLKYNGELNRELHREK
jgi:hypothetical protein